jgi:hypothetical protein
MKPKHIHIRKINHNCLLLTTTQQRTLAKALMGKAPAPNEKLLSLLSVVSKWFK